MTPKPEPEIVTGVVLDYRTERNPILDRQIMILDTDQHGVIEIDLGDGPPILPEVSKRIKIQVKPKLRPGMWRSLALTKKDHQAGDLPVHYEVIEPEHPEPSDDPSTITLTALRRARAVLIEALMRLNRGTIDPCSEMGWLTFPIGILDRAILQHTKPPTTLRAQVKDFQQQLRQWEEYVDDLRGSRDELIRHIYTRREKGDAEAKDLNLQAETGLSTQRLNQIKHSTR